MEPQELQDILNNLPPRQKEVLILVCQGSKYQEIAAKMTISENTVKSHMGKIYQAFEIDGITSQERRKVLFQRICYYVHELEIESATSAADEEALVEPDPLPERVRRIVDEDEKALTVWEPKPIVKPDIWEPKPILRWITCGAIAGLAAVIAIGYYLQQSGILNIDINAGDETAPEIADRTSTATEPMEEVQSSTEITSQEPTEIDSPAADPSPFPSNTPIPSITPLPQPPPISIPLPYSDTFDLRMRPEWEPLIGSWRVVDGHLTADNFDDWARILTGDPGWQNYTVDVDVWADDWFYPVQIIVRAQDEGYMAVEININNTDIFLYADGEFVAIAHSDTGINDHLEGGRYKRVYHLRVIANHDIFSFYVDGMRILQVQDTTFEWGRVGVAFRTFYDPTWFDNFTVTTLP